MIANEFLEQFFAQHLTVKYCTKNCGMFFHQKKQNNNTTGNMHIEVVNEHQDWLYCSTIERKLQFSLEDFKYTTFRTNITNDDKISTLKTLKK